VGVPPHQARPSALGFAKAAAIHGHGDGGHRTESIYRRYAIVDEVMLHEGAAKVAAYSEGRVLGKVKGATGIAPS
jgi:hypothetical protein